MIQILVYKNFVDKTNKSIFLNISRRLKKKRFIHCAHFESYSCLGFENSFNSQFCSATFYFTVQRTNVLTDKRPNVRKATLRYYYYFRFTDYRVFFEYGMPSHVLIKQNISIYVDRQGRARIGYLAHFVFLTS